MDKFNKIIYDGKPCRIIAVDKGHEVLLEDKDGNVFTVDALVVSEQEIVTRNNAETR